jgi:co-chaperonin GroES (HSP10)
MKGFAFTPFLGAVCVRRMKNDVSGGKIIRTTKEHRYPARGVVIETGDANYVSVGDVILYNMSILEDLNIDGEVFDLVMEQNVLGVFR